MFSTQELLIYSEINGHLGIKSLSQIIVFGRIPFEKKARHHRLHQSFICQKRSLLASNQNGWENYLIGC